MVTTPGIDVSAHQGASIDWPKVAASGVRWAYLRAYEGQTPDVTYERNRREALAAGLLVGSYQYLRARHLGRYQADLLLAALGDLQPGELPPCVDVEELDGRDAARVRDCLLAWVERVSTFIDRDPVVYTGPAFWSAQLRGEGLTTLAECPLWIADYRPRPAPEVPAPWSAWAMWQHSGSGRVEGVPGACDVNHWAGDEASLRAWAGAVCG